MIETTASLRVSQALVPVSGDDPPATEAAVAGAELPERARFTQERMPGTQAPNATLRTLEGAAVDLSSFYGSQPLALIFYRGGW